jgi:hypothetical protein
MKTFLITEDEKKRILNMHKTRTANHYLSEQLMSGDPIPNEYKDLIGKTVIFKYKNTIEITSKSSPGDVWHEDAIKELGTEDKRVYDDVINSPIRGKIIAVMGASSNDAMVRLTVKNISTELGFSFYNNEDNIIYRCGTNTFETDIEISQAASVNGPFFEDKIVNVGYTCPSLSQYLEKKLPCGNFDFSMKDTDTLPGTLS